ncbi:F-box protein At5g07610-like [Cornus florida]|uniref:F-box protein At5g07610-like n=1 Tax=Cornus florida TaxID=4283 RepID=UPI00289C398B|nr:F-box protein At5g07610-like [Cornus florida]
MANVDGISAATESFSGVDDLIQEILLRLPAKSLMRFKSVSKTWFSFISSHHFSLLWHNHRQLSDPKVSGLFFSYSGPIEGNSIEYIPLKENLDHRENDSHFISRLPGFDERVLCSTETQLVGSSNGLLLYCHLDLYENHYRFRVYNPATKKFSDIPWLWDPNEYRSIHLVFDPVKSPHYKVVAIRSPRDSKIFCQISVYSSDTGAWRPSGDRFKVRPDTKFGDRVFWNDTIIWFYYTREASLCFNVEQERRFTIPPPRIRGRSLKPEDATFRHFGVSNGHLHLVELNGYCRTKIDVFEMERDYSHWFLKYEIDIVPIFKEIVGCNMDFAFSVFSLIHGEVEEDSVLVLNVRDTIISYSFRDNTLKKLCRLGPHAGYYPNPRLQRSYGRFDVHQYMETLFPV